MICNVGIAIVNYPLNHHFDGWYVYHQNWVVYVIAIPTLVHHENPHIIIAVIALRRYSPGHGRNDGRQGPSGAVVGTPCGVTAGKSPGRPGWDISEHFTCLVGGLEHVKDV